MKRRLRKKLHLEEFAIKGFEFTCRIAQGNQIDAFFDALVEVIEANNLWIDGSGSEEEFIGYVTSGERYGSVTDAEKDTISKWLNAFAGIENVEVFEMTDACYGDIKSA